MAYKTLEGLAVACEVNLIASTSYSGLLSVLFMQPLSLCTFASPS